MIVSEEKDWQEYMSRMGNHAVIVETEESVRTKRELYILDRCFQVLFRTNKVWNRAMTELTPEIKRQLKAFGVTKEVTEFALAENLYDHMSTLRVRFLTTERFERFAPLVPGALAPLNFAVPTEPSSPAYTAFSEALECYGNRTFKEELEKIAKIRRQYDPENVKETDETIGAKQQAAIDAYERWAAAGSVVPFYCF